MFMLDIPTESGAGFESGPKTSRLPVLVDAKSQRHTMVGKNDQNKNTSYTLLPRNPNMYTHYLGVLGITTAIYQKGF